MDISIRPMAPAEAPVVRRLGRRAFFGVESLCVGRPKAALVAAWSKAMFGALAFISVAVMVWQG